jgi:hypothetical protein
MLRDATFGPVIWHLSAAGWHRRRVELRRRVSKFLCSVTALCADEGKARYLRDPRWWQGLSCSCTAAFCTTCLAWRKPGMSQSCRVILAKFVLMGNAGDRWGCERRRELDRPRSALLPAASHVSALINARLGTCASCLWRTWLHSQSL